MSSLVEINNRLNRQLIKFSFGSGVRVDFYRSLLMLIDNNVRLNEALKELYGVYSAGGKKKNQPVAKVIDDCLDNMNNGLSFTDALSHWVPLDEAMLLKAGELAGTLGKAFAEVEYIMNAKKKINGAVFGAISYPVVLFSMMGFLLHMIATDLVPKLAKVVSSDRWTGPAAALHHIAWFVNNYAVVSVAVIGILLVVVVISLPVYNGRLRVYLDKIPPWSIYRMINGASFLLNVSALIKSGMRLNMALDKLSAHANPWLKKRIRAANEGLAQGANFGEALSESGYDFPDKKANRFISVIANYSGVDVAISKFGVRWLEETVVKIQSLSKVILVIGVMSVGVTMLLVIGGAGSLQDIIQSSVN